jgi:hypothetical protein
MRENYVFPRIMYGMCPGLNQGNLEVISVILKR